MIKNPLRLWIVGFLGMTGAFVLFLFVFLDNGRLDVATGGPKIGLVRIEGVIMGASDVVADLKRFNNDKSVKAIILRINSPGGAVVPSQDIYDELRKIRDEGRVRLVTSMGTVAASGGYYIASATDRIFASKGTLTGSIGVIMEMPNLEKLFEKLGVGNTVIKSGRFKDMGSPFRKIGEKETAVLQGVMDDIYEQFLEDVAYGRKLAVKDVAKIAEGKVYSGRQALKIGLVDDIGNYEDVVDATAEMVGIKGEPNVVEHKKRVSLLEYIETSFGQLLPISANAGRNISPFKFLLTTGY